MDKCLERNHNDHAHVARRQSAQPGCAVPTRPDMIARVASEGLWTETERIAGFVITSLIEYVYTFESEDLCEAWIH